MEQHDVLTACAHLEAVVSRPATAADAIDGCQPAAIVRPLTEAAVGATLRLANERGWAVVPRGGGSRLALGNRLTRLDLALDLATLNEVIEHQPRDLTMTVGAGISVAAAQAAARAAGQWLPLDPSLPDRSTIGGALAANASGPRRQLYRTGRDTVIGTTAALPDGSLVKAGGRVVKNVAGYDLSKLWIGSAGTLAVLTRVTFRLYPLPPARALVVGAFADAASAHAGALTMLATPLNPSIVELTNAPLPGFPADDQWRLCVELSGLPAAVARARADVQALIERGGGAARTLAAGAAEHCYVTLRDFGQGTASPVLLRAAVLPSAVADVCASALRLAPVGVRPTVAARVGAGVVSIAATTDDDAVALAYTEALRARVRQRGGALVVERAPVAVKDQLDVWDVAGTELTLMMRLKETYDPGGTLSPGRAPGGR